MLYYKAWPDGEIDHINGDRADNRICNLRVVSKQQNARNVGLGKGNVSGHLGVSYSSRDKRWAAHIGVNGVRVYLGSFRDKDSAVAARLEAESRYGFHSNSGQRPSHNSMLLEATGK